MDDEFDSEQVRAMTALEPIWPRVLPIFSSAMDLYNTGTSVRARAEHSDRAAANAVYCHVWQGFQREFGEDDGFHFLDVQGLQVLNIRDEFVIRAKKVDANGRHRNYRTKQQRTYDLQGDIPGMPPAAVRLVVGYQPDVAFSEVERVTVRQAGRGWVAQVVEVDGPQSWVDITPNREFSFGEVRRKTGG